jgi:hypothetical protein
MCHGMSLPPHFIGPILILDDLKSEQMHIAALVVARGTQVPKALLTEQGPVEFEKSISFAQFSVWRARFSVSANRPAYYVWNDTRYDLACDLGDDMRLAYVSCNGEEHGDMDRDPQERNVMWNRLVQQHRNAPFSLLIQGGDQIYADEVTDNHPLSAGWPLDVPQDCSEQELAALFDTLREGFAERYVALYAQPDFAYLAARVPSLMQWDDHDICDGWGSLPDQATKSGIGQTLFAAARETALIFQHGCTDGDLPARFCDPSGTDLSWHVETDSLRLLAPDLRSQRSMTEIMGPTGWQFMEEMASAPAPQRTFFISSVPLLGPRLSWIERAMRRIPGIQKYEDDLRDQWQSRTHRAAWCRMLRLVQKMAAPPQAQITAVSGEIHLATRGEMQLPNDKMLHQLVASGITHRPPPKVWARILGTLAAFGEDPLPESPITIRPLPGQRHRYTTERNALTLVRTDGKWAAQWLLEHSGPTPPLSL